MTDWYNPTSEYNPTLKPSDNIGREYDFKIKGPPERIDLPRGQQALKLTVECDGKERSMLLHADLARKLHDLELSRGSLKDAVVKVTCIEKRRTRTGHTQYIYKLVYEGREIE